MSIFIQFVLFPKYYILFWKQNKLKQTELKPIFFELNNEI
jgi:hypothetical protein